MQAILRPAPESPVGPDGAPAFGAYRGYAQRVSWAGLAQRRDPLWRALHTKTWHYASVATAECVVAIAVIDVGIAASAFVYVFDRRARKLLTNQSFTSLPSAATFSPFAGIGASSRFRTRNARLAIERSGATWRVYAHAQNDSDIEIAAELDVSAAPSPLCAIAPIEGGIANCTHKTVGLAAKGTARVGSVRFDLGGGFGALDHTHGLLARDTKWRWASASSADLSLNLVEDFNGPVENVVWVGDELLPVGPVTFHYDANATLQPWRITSADGALDLEFVPEGERREDKNLVVAKSWYVQPIGTFRGTFRPPGREPIEVHDLVGVTEDHVAKW